MIRKLTYKPLSKELEKMAKPSSNSTIRSSLGLEGFVGEFFYISIEDLIPFHNQARQLFNEDEIHSLAESIKTYGVRHPLTIMSVENNKYEVISGERRLRAAKIAGLIKVPCIIINDAKQADAIALIENLHRKDLHPIELGRTYKNLLENRIFSTQAELGDKLSVTKSHVSEHLKYADLDLKIQKYIIDNNISAREKLRQIIKAHTNGEHNKIMQILGIEKFSSSNFSILRIILNEGNMKIQENGLQKLSSSQKDELKKYLSKLIDKI